MDLENNGDALDFSATMAEAFDKIQAPADETNTDTKAVEAPDKGAPAEGENKEIPVQGNSQVADPAANPQPIEPNAKWTDDVKAMFAKLPRDAQEFVLKREQDAERFLNQKSQELSEQQRQFQPLTQIAETRRQAALANGYPSVEAEMTDLYKISDAASRDPAGFIQWFAQQRGVDLASLIGAQPNPNNPQDAQRDPVLAAVQQQVNQITNDLNSQRQQQRQREIQEASQSIESFRSQTGTDGKPLYPHFDTVRDAMGKLLSTGLAADLKDAYEKAVFADPKVRELVLSEQRAAEEGKRLAEAKEAAEKAKKAAAVNVSSKSSAPSKKASGTIDDTMSAIWDDLNAA